MKIKLNLERVLAIAAWTLFANIVTKWTAPPTPVARFAWILASVAVGAAIAHFIPVKGTKS